MNRRDFFRRSAAIVAAAAVMDPLELIDRLQPRRLFPSIGFAGDPAYGSFAFIQTNSRFSLDGWAAGESINGGRVVAVDRKRGTITIDVPLPPISADDTIYFGTKRRRRRA